MEKHTSLCNRSRALKTCILLLTRPIESDYNLEDTYLSQQKHTASRKILSFQVHWCYSTSCSVIAWFQSCFSWTWLNLSKVMLDRQKGEALQPSNILQVITRMSHYSGWWEALIFSHLKDLFIFFLLTYLKTFNKGMVLSISS